MSVPRPFAERGATVPEAFSARLLGTHDPLFARLLAAGRNVFQSDALLAAIERHVVSGPDRLALVGVTDSAGNPLAMFPFVRRKRFGIPVIEAADFGIIDFFAPAYFRDAPLSARDTAKLWRTAVKAVPGVHAVAFKKLPRLLHRRPHALSGADFLQPMGASATTLFLRGPDQPPLDPEKISLAREVRRKSKKLEKHGALTFTEALSNAEVDAAMDTLVAFRAARFSELGRHDALLDPRVVAFYRCLADRAGDQPAGRLFTLRAGEHPVAVVYGFSCADAFTLIAPTITTCKEMQAGSPGLVALFRTLQWCKAHDYAVFDLSVGSLSYKRRFDAAPIELFECQQALSPLGLPVVFEGWLRRQVRRHALKHPKLHGMLERLRRRSGQRARDSGEHA